jgi:hypothetical protein
MADRNRILLISVESQKPESELSERRVQPERRHTASA